MEKHVEMERTVERTQDQKRSMIDRLFPEEVEVVRLEVGDSCRLDDDPREHRIVAVRADDAVVHLVALPSATHRRVPFGDCIPWQESAAS